LGSNHQGLFLTMGQADMWVQPNTWIQGDMCVEFKIEFEFAFVQDLE
jgi:hypothetical protein